MYSREADLDDRTRLRLAFARLFEFKTTESVGRLRWLREHDPHDTLIHDAMHVAHVRPTGRVIL